MELAKIRAVEVGGKWRLIKISKNRERSSKKMEVRIPVEASRVIKNGRV